MALHLKRYEFALPWCRGREVLDAGCGVGYGSAFLAREASRLLGVDRDDPARHITAKMTAVGTDDTMAVNFVKRFGSTGKLNGAFVKVVPTSLLVRAALWVGIRTSIESGTRCPI